jgi:hypothetical protein
MKIIFLNAWGGTMLGPFTEFIKESAPSTDFFCFQETFNYDGRVNLGSDLDGARSDIFRELERMLPDFSGFFAPTNTMRIGEAEVSDGLSIFGKKSIKIESKGDLTVYRSDKYPNRPLERTKNIEYVRFMHNGRETTLVNFHGAALPGSKLDTEERLGQSRHIVDFLNGEAGEKILGGDFNLMPQTESIGIIESAGMRNLIKDFNIESTRSDISYEKYKSEKVQQRFADFAFTSKGIKVRSFEVPRLNISDHLPLILQID